MSYIQVNDINLHFELQGQGPPLLFIHGLGASLRDWEYQIPYFKEKYRILTFSLRGHGQSDKPDHPYSVDIFANDTAELIRTLFPEGVHVVGHSLGGMIAFVLALNFPELIKTLTIVNSAPAVIFPNFKSQFFFYLRSFDVRLFGMRHLSTQLANAVFPKAEQAPLRATFIERWCENDPKAYLNTLRAFRGWTVMHRLGSILCPTLIISADQDYTPVSFKKFYTELIPNAELVVIKDSRHLTIVDQAAILNKTVDDFLMRHVI
ncbi:MAG: alpha/beta hydrolase [Proteobacteria bacterium]|nr:alpha/beta hydrolase [Pseudomonadota bacterium]